MTTKTNSYWVKRFEALENMSNEYAQETYASVEKSFNKAQRKIQAEIDVWYNRIAVNNNISLKDAKKLLNDKELKEFKWDVNEYIHYGKQNALNEQWMKELENASAKYHISRLEALKVRTQHELERAFGNELDDIDKMARRVYTEDYYHSAYEIQKGFNIGFNIGEIDDKKLDKLINKPWAADGKNFSNRIWQSKTSMINDLHNELVRTCILGKSPDDAIKKMTKYVDKKFNNAKLQAGRLIMTEQAFFSSAAQKDCFNELDVEQYEVVATLDSHTSEICQNLDGQVFPMKDFQPGVTAPPFHVWCRSTTVPYFEDNFGGERAARGLDGKTYFVPDNMTYKEWNEAFVDGNVENLQELPKSDIIKVNKDSEIYKKLGEDNYNGMHELLKNAPKKEQQLWAKMEDKLTVVNANANVHPCNHGVSGIEMNVTKDSKGTSWSKPYQTTFHEFGHNIDYIANKEYGNGYSFYPYSYTYKDNIFGKTIKQEIADKVDEIAAAMKQDFKTHAKDYEYLFNKGYIGEWNYNMYKQTGRWMTEPKFQKSMAYKELEKEIRALGNAKADLSDIVEGATNGKVKAGFGHGNSYWKDAQKLSTEAFAEMFDSTVANPEQLEPIKKYLPKSYEIFQEMIDNILKG